MEGAVSLHAVFSEEAALRAAIEAQHVSTVIFDADVPESIALQIDALMGGNEHAIRSIDPVIYLRSPKYVCYSIQNPVLDLSGRIVEPFFMKKLKASNEQHAARRLVKEALANPGRRISWNCTSPSAVVVDTLREMKFDGPVKYLECSTQHGESLCYAGRILPPGSTLYAMDFYQKAKGFPVSARIAKRCEIVRLGYTGNRGYIKALQDLERE